MKNLKFIFILLMFVIGANWATAQNDRDEALISQQVTVGGGDSLIAVAYDPLTGAFTITTDVGQPLNTTIPLDTAANSFAVNGYGGTMTDQAYMDSIRANLLIITPFALDPLSQGASYNPLTGLLIEPDSAKAVFMTNPFGGTNTSGAYLDSLYARRFGLNPLSVGASYDPLTGLLIEPDSASQSYVLNPYGGTNTDKGYMDSLKVKTDALLASDQPLTTNDPSQIFGVIDPTADTFLLKWTHIAAAPIIMGGNGIQNTDDVLFFDHDGDASRWELNENATTGDFDFKFPQNVALYQLNKSGTASKNGDLMTWQQFNADSVKLATSNANLIDVVRNGRNDYTLDVKALLITDVTVDAAVADINAWVAANYTGTEAQEGDLIITTTDGKSWIHNGGVAGTVADFTEVNAPNVTDAAIRALFSSTNTGITYNPLNGQFTFNLDPASGGASLGANGLLIDPDSASTSYALNPYGGTLTDMGYMDSLKAQIDGFTQLTLDPATSVLDAEINANGLLVKPDSAITNYALNPFGGTNTTMAYLDSLNANSNKFILNPASVGASYNAVTGLLIHPDTASMTYAVNGWGGTTTAQAYVDSAKVHIDQLEANDQPLVNQNLTQIIGTIDPTTDQFNLTWTHAAAQNVLMQTNNLMNTGAVNFSNNDADGFPWQITESATTGDLQFQFPFTTDLYQLNKGGTATKNGDLVPWEQLNADSTIIRSGNTNLLTATRNARNDWTLNVGALAITDVVVDAVAGDLTTWVGANYTGTEYQEGDVAILTAAGEAWIHNGNATNGVGDFTQIEAPSVTNNAIRALFSSDNAAILYNPLTGVFQFTLDPATNALDAEITANGLLVHPDSAQTNYAVNPYGGTQTSQAYMDSLRAAIIAGGSFALDPATLPQDAEITANGLLVHPDSARNTYALNPFGGDNTIRSYTDSILVNLRFGGWVTGSYNQTANQVQNARGFTQAYNNLGALTFVTNNGASFNMEGNRITLGSVMDSIMLQNSTIREGWVMTIDSTAAGVGRITFTDPATFGGVDSTLATLEAGVNMTYAANTGGGLNSIIKNNYFNILDSVWLVPFLTADPDTTTAEILDETAVLVEEAGVKKYATVRQIANSTKQATVANGATLTVSDETHVYADGGSTVELPVNLRQEVTIMSDPCTTGDVTVQANGGATLIDGATGITLPDAAYTSVKLIYNDATGEYRISGEHTEFVIKTVTMNVTGATTAGLLIHRAGGQNWIVDWGDGTAAQSVASGFQQIHTYATPYTGIITVSGLCSIDDIINLQLKGDRFSDDLPTLFAQLPSLVDFRGGRELLTGDLAAATAFTPNLGYIDVGENIGIFGNIESALSNTPALYYINAGSFSMTTPFTGNAGIAAGLMANPTRFSVYGGNLTGNIEFITTQLGTTLNSLQITGHGNMITGNLETAMANIPNVNEFSVWSDGNTMTGDIDAALAFTPSIQVFTVTGNSNTFTGDLNAASASTPNMLRFTVDTETGSASGDLTTILGNWTNATIFYLDGGNNTLTGNITTAMPLTPNLQQLIIIGSSTGTNITGDLLTAFAGNTTMRIFSIDANANLSGAGAIAFPNTFWQFSYQPTTTGMSLADLDNVIAELATDVTTWQSVNEVNLTGVNPAPTVNASYTTLQGNVLFFNHN